MTLRPAHGALAVTLLFLVTACGPSGASAEAADPATQTAPFEWANQQFNEEVWGGPGVYQASGGIGLGAGLEFTPDQPGWYSIGMACEGTSSVTFTVTTADGDVGSGSADCGPAVTTAMELPAKKVSVAVEGAEAKGTWALALAPTEAP